jgi:hypothetical protein
MVNALFSSWRLCRIPGGPDQELLERPRWRRCVRVKHTFAVLLLPCLAGLVDAQPYSLRGELDIPILIGALAMKQHSGNLLGQTRENRVDPATLDRQDVPAFDRWSIGFYSPQLSAFSSVVSAGILMIPISVNVWDTRQGRQAWHGALTDVILLQEATMIASSLSNYSKSVPMHSTPLTYDPDVPDAQKRTAHNVSSFFSNHTTTAFTTAVYSAYTFQLRHPESPLVPWIWAGSLGMASGVGSLRIAAGKHFLSDVLVGAAVGSLFGYLIPRLHLNRMNQSMADEETKSPALTWNLGVAFPSGVPGPALHVNF